MIGILGGGLSGVALASFLKQPSTVFEAEDRLGGLCRTFTKDGLSTDLGGHILFSRDPALLDLMTAPLGENVHTRRRENHIAHNGRIMNWPFENGLGGLDPEERAELVLSYLDARSHIGETVGASFELWAVDRFGDAMARAFLIPYTEKVFKTPARELASDWSTRVPRPPVADVVRSALGLETVGYQHQAEFRYPREGGIEALILSLRRAGTPGFQVFQVGTKIDQLETIDTGWTVQCGWNIERGNLVSTLPLAVLVDALDGVPAEVERAAHALRWNSLTVVTFGFDVPIARAVDWTAIYVATPGFPFHRACFNRAFSESMCPPGRWSVSCEVTHDAREFAFTHDRERMILDCLRALPVSAEPVSVQDHYVKHAYPVPTLDCARNRATVLGYLESIGIHCLGRAGRHEYLNMDQCVAAARDLARKLDGDK